MHTKFWSENMKKPLGWPRRRWWDNIRMNIGETGWDGVDGVHLTQDRVQWRTLVNTVLNLGFHKILSFLIDLFYLTVSRGFYLWIYRQLVGLLGRVIGPTQGLYLQTGQHNTDIHPSPEKDSNLRSQHPSERRQYLPQTARLLRPARSIKCEWLLACEEGLCYTESAKFQYHVTMHSSQVKLQRSIR
jgi:hypothetical protein